MAGTKITIFITRYFCIRIPAEQLYFRTLLASSAIRSCKNISLQNLLTVKDCSGKGSIPEAEEAKKKQGANNYLLIIGVYCVHRSAGLRDLLYWTVESKQYCYTFGHDTNSCCTY